MVFVLLFKPDRAPVDGEDDERRMTRKPQNYGRLYNKFDDKNPNNNRNGPKRDFSL